MTEEGVKLFVAEHCKPCINIKRMVSEGKFTIDGEEGKVEMVDIESEEGYAQLQNYPITGVPAAFKGQKECRILLDEENDTIDLKCKEDEPA